VGGDRAALDAEVGDHQCSVEDGQPNEGRQHFTRGGTTDDEGDPQGEATSGEAQEGDPDVHGRHGTPGMIVRACLGVPGFPCGQLIPPRRRRCIPHQRQWEAARVARRGSVYDRGHRKRAGDAIEEEPWCHWPGCMRTTDLTGAHLLAGDADGGYTVLCRAHNSEEANRCRAGGDGSHRKVSGRR